MGVGVQGGGEDAGGACLLAQGVGILQRLHADTLTQRWGHDLCKSHILGVSASLCLAAMSVRC